MLEWVLYLIIFIIVIMILSAIRALREYERGVIFRLGRLLGARGPGLFFVWPIIDKMVRVDLRVTALNISSQEVTTKDNEKIKINAEVYYKITEPVKAVTKVESYTHAMSMLVKETLRSVIGGYRFDEIKTKKDELNKPIAEILNKAANPWGIKVTAVEIKDIEG
jgi:regulator of protease activity HflC (stomatin/prohibitin superfamily)